jgi:adenylate kinase family enzyme
MRINIIGTSGSGKTSFGKELAEILDIPFIEMDAIFWGPNWTPMAKEKFRSQLDQALQGDNWVLDGNYTQASMPIKWARVEIVIWLDFSFPRTLHQALSRAIQRVFSQQEIWPGTGNRESLRMLFSRDSIVLWTITSYHPKRKKIEALMNDPAYQYIHFHQVRSPREAAKLLEVVNHNPNSLYTGLVPGK